MSTDAEPALPAAPATSEVPKTRSVLTPPERRVLGVLVEKAKITPDVYPLSVNALVAGCNQKSSRDPIVNYTEPEVEEVLTSLQAKGLTIKVTGGRVVRWRHALYEALHVDKIELAVLADLLLRGPQTEGELRGRASRMEPIADLDLLRQVLRKLAERGLVVHLSPEGRRGAMVTHGFHDPQEVKYVLSATEQPRAVEPSGSDSQARPDDVRTELSALRRMAEDLERRVEELARLFGETRTGDS
jgi:uncharacterized protein YceH (UPF0502 family)